MRLAELSIPELLRLHASTIAELRTRAVVRTSNNPVGDYTEWLVAKALGLQLEANSSSGHDATSTDGRRLQIKGRRVTPTNKSRQLGAIRNLANKDFDELVAVIFDEDFGILEAVVIPHPVVSEFSSYRAHVNANILHVRGALLFDPRVRSIREELNAVIASMMA
jgi:hypothetical protein